MPSPATNILHKVEVPDKEVIQTEEISTEEVESEQYQ